MEKELIMQMKILEQEAEQFNQQSQLIDQNLSDMQELMNSIEEIDKTKNKELLVDIGRKIFLPVEIKKREFIVDVGNTKHFILNQAFAVGLKVERLP